MIRLNFLFESVASGGESTRVAHALYFSIRQRDLDSRISSFVQNSETPLFELLRDGTIESIGLRGENQFAGSRLVPLLSGRPFRFLESESTRIHPSEVVFRSGKARIKDVTGAITQIPFSYYGK